MLEASDFELIDQVPPFFGGIVDVICGNENKAPATEVSTMDFDLNITLKTKLTQPWWKVKELSGLAKLICKFKDVGTKLFGKY